MPSTTVGYKLIKEEDVKVGNILGLGGYEDVVASFKARSHEAAEPVINLTRPGAPDDVPYEHPILVISRSPSASNNVQFLVVSGRMYSLSVAFETDT